MLLNTTLQGLSSQTVIVKPCDIMWMSLEINVEVHVQITKVEVVPDLGAESGVVEVLQSKEISCCRSCFRAPQSGIVNAIQLLEGMQHCLSCWDTDVVRV